MQTKIVLASLVAVASADILALRQATNPGGTLSKQCEADLAEVKSQSDLPMVPTQVIQDAVAAAATLTNPCDYTPTGTVAEMYTSFLSAAESWASKHTSIASKIEKDCNAAIQDIGAICPTNGDSAKPTSSSGSSGSKTTSGSGSGSSSEASGTTSGGQAKATGNGKSAAANGPAAAGALMVAALGAVALL